MLLVKANLHTEPSESKVYRAIPELPIEHAYGREALAKQETFPLQLPNALVYKVPKSLLKRWDNI